MGEPRLELRIWRTGGVGLVEVRNKWRAIREIRGYHWSFGSDSKKTPRSGTDFVMSSNHLQRATRFVVSKQS